MQEVRNAVDQAQRELSTRFDFKGTDSTVELHDMELRIHSATEDRLRAVVQVIEEKLVKRKVSLKALDYGKPEEAAKVPSARRSPSRPASRPTTPRPSTGGSRRRPRRAYRRRLRRPGPGDRQEARRSARRHAGLREEDFGIPLQFENFRD